MRRIVTSTIAAALSLTALAACSSGEAESAPAPEVTIDGGPGTFTPEEQEVVDAVLSYFDAFLTRKDAGVESAVEGLLSDDLQARLIPDEKKAVDDAGLWYIGDATLDPKNVSIDGDTASFTGCQDASEVFLVPVGEEKAGPGSRVLGSSDLSIGLVRVDDEWLIDEPNSEKVESC